MPSPFLNDFEQQYSCINNKAVGTSNEEVGRSNGWLKIEIDLPWTVTMAENELDNQTVYF